jgi:hypothetical protein
LNRAIKVVVKDHHSRFGKRHDMGEFETTIQRFIECKENGGDVDDDMSFTLRLGHKVVGRIMVVQACIESEPVANDQTYVEEAKPVRPEFVDYLTGGCQINLAVAIDFTASNGK